MRKANGKKRDCVVLIKRRIFSSAKLNILIYESFIGETTMLEKVLFFKFDSVLFCTHS